MRRVSDGSIPQGIIAAQFDDDESSVLGHRPIQPFQSPLLVLAGDAGIGDIGRDALPCQNVSQLNRKGIALIEL